MISQHFLQFSDKLLYKSALNNYNKQLLLSIIIHEVDN